MEKSNEKEEVKSSSTASGMAGTTSGAKTSADTSDKKPLMGQPGKDSASDKKDDFKSSSSGMKTSASKDPQLSSLKRDNEDGRENRSGYKDQLAGKDSYDSQNINRDFGSQNPNQYGNQGNYDSQRAFDQEDQRSFERQGGYESNQYGSQNRYQGNDAQNQYGNQRAYEQQQYGQNQFANGYGQNQYGYGYDNRRNYRPNQQGGNAGSQSWQGGFGNPQRSYQGEEFGFGQAYEGGYYPEYGSSNRQYQQFGGTNQFGGRNQGYSQQSRGYEDGSYGGGRYEKSQEWDRRGPSSFSNHGNRQGRNWNMNPDWNSEEYGTNRNYSRGSNQYQNRDEGFYSGEGEMREQQFDRNRNTGRNRFRDFERAPRDFENENSRFADNDRENYNRSRDRYDEDDRYNDRSWGNRNHERRF